MTDKMTIGDLSGYEGPLYVKNNSPSRIIHDDGRGNTLHLAPSGADGDIAMLPLEVARHPGFQRAWRRGAFEVTNDSDMEERLGQIRPDTSQDVINKILGGQATMESNPANLDLMSVSCSSCNLTDYLPVNVASQNLGKKLCEVSESKKGLECPHRI